MPSKLFSTLLHHPHAPLLFGFSDSLRNGTPLWGYPMQFCHIAYPSTCCKWSREWTSGNGNMALRAYIVAGGPYQLQTCNGKRHYSPYSVAGLPPLGPPATPPSAKTISGLLQLDLLQRHNQPKPFLAYSTWTSCNGNATRPICQFRPPSTPTTLILYTMGLVYLALFSESGANCLKEKEKIAIFARMCGESGPRLSCTTTEKESNSYEKSVSYQYAFA